MVSGLETVDFPLLDEIVSATSLQQVQNHMKPSISVSCGAVRLLQDALGTEGSHCSRSLYDIQIGVHQRLLNAKTSLLAHKVINLQVAEGFETLHRDISKGLSCPGPPFQKVSVLGVLGAPYRDLPPELGVRGWKPLARCA